MTKSPESMFKIRVRMTEAKTDVENAHLNPNRSAACFKSTVSRRRILRKKKNIYSGIVKDKTRRGIDGHCPCVCSRIRCLTSMKLKSIEIWLSATVY